MAFIICSTGALLLGLCTVAFVHGTDPCTSYTSINDPLRSVNAKVTSGVFGCDGGLKKGWYRFQSAAGGKMPTYPPPSEEYCKAEAPIWLNGTHPEHAEEERDLKACVRFIVECNPFWTATIRAKKCLVGNEDYFVYNLVPTPTGCSPSMVYCAGNNTRCENGTRSIDWEDFAPCSDIYPDPPSATMQLPMVTDTDIFFNCTFSPAPSTHNFSLKYDVEIFAMEPDIPFKNHTIKKYSGLTKTWAAINQEDWASKSIKLGKHICCRVRSRYDESDTAPSLWITSNSHFIGARIISDKFIQISHGQTPNINVTLELTIPVVCPYEGPKKKFCKYARVSMYFGVDQTNNPIGCAAADELQLHKCGHEIDFDSSIITITIPIYVRASSMVNFHTSYNLDVFTRNILIPPIWSHYYIGTIKIQVSHPNPVGNPTASAICKSINDPHFTTFNGGPFNFYTEGSFLLYHNKRFGDKVFIKTVLCNLRNGLNVASCNCLVAIQTDDDLLVIDRCETRTVSVTPTSTFEFNERKITLFRNGDLPQGFSVVFKSGSTTIIVTLPSGTKVTVLDGYPRNELLNVEVHSSYADRSTLDDDLNWVHYTDGLCGVFDGNCIPKVVKKNAENGTFTINTTDRNIFKFGLPKMERNISFCICDKEGVIICNNTCTTGRYNPRQKRWTDEDVRALSDIRIVEVNGMTFTDSVFPIDEDYLPASDFVQTRNRRSIAETPTWPTASGWTQANATRFCRDAILNDPATIAGKEARPDVDEYELFINSCIEDILQSDGTGWIQDTLGMLKLQNEALIVANVSAWETDDEGQPTQPPKEFLDMLCPKNCSGNGECDNGVCQCNDDYISFDCSSEKTRPPDVYFIPGKSLCDTRQRPCFATPVMGNNFVESSNLSCLMKHITVFSNGSSVIDSEEIRTEAEFSSYQRVLCNLPTIRQKRASEAVDLPAVGYEVSVANDGDAWSRTVTLVVYDSVCVNCTGLGTTECMFKSNTCAINGECYSAQERFMGDPCVTCSPELSPHAWKNVTNSCAIGDRCIPDGQVDDDDPCRICDVARDRTVWSVLPGNEAVNLSSCAINESCIPHGQLNADDPCRVCDAAKDRTSWSIVPDCPAQRETSTDLTPGIPVVILAPSIAAGLAVLIGGSIIVIYLIKKKIMVPTKIRPIS